MEKGWYSWEARRRRARRPERNTARAMSEENVEIVKAVHPPSGTDLTRLFADDSEAPGRLEAVAPLFHPEFEFVVGITEEENPAFRGSGGGLAELVEMWREWIEPWEVYWTEVEDFIDAGDDRVLVLIRDHGRLQGSGAEIDLIAASLWTLRNGKIARIEFYVSREQALEAAGLRE
jgi:ketosteroid isomerase-like protein